MEEVARLVPVLPVSLIATVLLEIESPIDALELKVRAGNLMRHFEANGARLYVPRADRDYAIQVGLRMLTLRGLVEERDGLLRNGRGGAADCSPTTPIRWHTCADDAEQALANTS